MDHTVRGADQESRSNVRCVVRSHVADVSQWLRRQFSLWEPTALSSPLYKRIEQYSSPHARIYLPLVNGTDHNSRLTPASRQRPHYQGRTIRRPATGRDHTFGSK